MGRKDMMLLAIFLGCVLGIPAGIWVMHVQWNSTKGLWDIPLSERQAWLADKKSDAIFKLFIFKFLIKGGIISCIALAFYLAHYVWG